MNTEAQVESRLAAAFSASMTPTERGWLDARVAAVLERTPATRRRFRFRLSRTLLLVAALLIVLPSIFVASAALRNTEAPSGMGSAEQYDAELAAAKAVTPIPPGATWPPSLERAEDRRASYGTGLGWAMVEYNAYCLWLGEWYQAREAGEPARVEAAAVVLNDVRGWTTFTDPLTSDQGSRAGTNAVIDAVRDGDAGLVLRELELNCQGTWPPRDR